MKNIVLVTGASSGFGRLTAEALARAGHVVYASMRDVAGRNANNAAALRAYGEKVGGELRVVELDVQASGSAQAAVDAIVAESGAIDVVIHNAGHRFTSSSRFSAASEVSGTTVSAESSSTSRSGILVSRPSARAFGRVRSIKPARKTPPRVPDAPEPVRSERMGRWKRR